MKGQIKRRINKSIKSAATSYIYHLTERVIRMKSILLYAVFCFLFSIFIFERKKIYKKIGPYMEKYVWKHIPYSIGYPIFLFLMLVVVKYTATSSDDGIANQLYLGSIFIFFMMAFTSVYELIEKFGVYVSRKMTFSKFLFQIFLSLLSIVICFGFTYNALYYFDNSMFSSVINDGVFKEALQFVYFSFEIMFNTDVSDIRAENYYSQSITILESLTSFFVIVILIANYENIGKLFKKNNVQ